MNKKIYLKKLVNIHKLIFVLFLWSFSQQIQAQEIWSLEQCIDSAMQHNKTLKMQSNRLLISQEKHKEAKANLYPKLNAQAEYKYFTEQPTQLMPKNALNPEAPKGSFNEIVFGVPHNINAGLQLSIPLYNAQVYAGIKNSEIAKELNQLAYEKAEEQMLYDIRSLYYNAQILNHQMKFIEANLSNAERLLENMELLKKYDLAIGTDVNKVKLQTEQLQTQTKVIQDKYKQVLNMLKLNMGVALDKEIEVSEEILEPNSLDDERRSSIELRTIQTQNKLLGNELKALNRSRLLPTISLMASYGTMGFGYDKSPNSFLDFYPTSFAALQVSCPIFNGTITKRKMNQKKLEIDNNKLQAELIADKNEMEIENAIRQRNTAQNSIQDTKTQIDLAQNIYEQSLLQQKHGTASLTDLLLADNSLREAQQNYLNAMVDFLKADLEYKIKTGRIKN